MSVIKEVKINWLGNPESCDDTKRRINWFLNSDMSNRPKVDTNNNFSESIYQDLPAFYLNSTESLTGVGLAVKPGGTFLTVIGSDFAIESGYQGAKEIVTFDINLNQLYLAALKLKGAQNFDYFKHFDFFSNFMASSFLSLDEYNRLKQDALHDPSLYAFFDDFMVQRDCEKRQSGHNTGTPIFNHIQSLRGVSLSQLRQINNQIKKPDYDVYIADKENYRAMQKKIAITNISFVEANFRFLADRLPKAGIPERYDGIYCSNIPAFFTGEEFYNIVKTQLMPILEDNGAIVYCCQGVSKDTLVNPNNINLLGLLSLTMRLTSPHISPYAEIHMKNSIEAYKLLSKEFNVDLQPSPYSGRNNGLNLEDTFVRIRKRKHYTH